MIRAAAQALLSHWRAHRLLLATLLTGIALATGLWSAVQAINAEARASYERASQQLGLGQFDILRDPAGPLSISRYTALRRAGWQVAAVLEGDYRINGQTMQLMGVDMLNYPVLPALAGGETDRPAPDPVEVLTEPGRLLMHPDAARLITGRDDLPPVLATQSLPTNLILTDIAVAERMLDRPGQISLLTLLPGQARNLPALAEIAPELELQRPAAEMDTRQLTNSFHLNLAAFGLLSFAVGLFIVHGTVGLAFAQRRSLIRTLRALGLPLRSLVMLILGELTLIALIGGSAGLIIGFFLAGALIPDVAATLRGLYGAPVDGQLVLRPLWVLTGFAMALGGTYLASAQALMRLAQLPLLAGPGLMAWDGSGRWARLSGLAGLGLGAAGLALFWQLDGLIAGFVLLGGLLTAAALLLPLLLSICLRGFERLTGGALTPWIWADMRSQIPGLSLALMALLLALATNIGVGTMVSSFRETFTGWLDQRLTSELYVTAKDGEQAGQIAEWLDPQVDAILPIRRIELRHATGPLFLYGFIDHQTYRQNWPLISAQPGVWDKVATGDAVLINEQLARRASLWPGDSLSLPGLPDLPIAGVYSDYGNPTGQAMVSMGRLDLIDPQGQTSRFGIRLPAAEATGMANALRARFDLPPLSVVQQAEMKAQSVAIFDRTFVVTSALNVLTLGVAGFAILTSLLTLWTQRMPQIAPVWALGVTRQKLGWLELLRSLLLATMTTCLALPLGLLLAWLLLAVINVEAFGWRLPMQLFPRDWLVLLGLTLIAATLAAAVPVLRLYHLKPADLLRIFASER